MADSGPANRPRYADGGTSRCDLRLADPMRDGPVGIDELARRVGADPDALARLMRHLVAHGMFSQPQPGVFGANATAALLDSAHPSGMQVSLDLSGFGGQMDLVFTELLHTVITGEPAWQRKYGAPYWEYLAADPVMSASFDQAMSAGAEYVRDDLASYDWSTAEHVVDVGGGTGAFVAALLHEHAQLHITLVDLPATVERARTYLGDQGLDSRVDFAAQSFSTHCRAVVMFTCSTASSTTGPMMPRQQSCAGAPKLPGRRGGS